MSTSPGISYLHLAITCLFSEHPLCNKTQKKYLCYQNSLAQGKKKTKTTPKQQDVKTKQPKLNVFPDKVYDTERSV